MHERDVVMLVFDGAKLLDVAGPAEVFSEANTFGARYRLRYVSPSGDPARTSAGFRIPVDGDADAVAEADTVVVAGGDRLVDRPVPSGLVEAVSTLRNRTQRLVSICTGSFVLAAAGVLDGRRATTHWRHAALLARAFPDVTVEPDPLFVKDGDVFTSAGVSAGIDLALALVEDDHGPDVARDVARNLVMFMQRPGGQSQFSAPLALRPPQAPTIRPLLELIAAQPTLDHSTASLAARAGVSTRHLTRLFAAELDTTPAMYVARVRQDHARALLDTGHSVSQAARLSGLGSAETLRRTFRARLGVSPSQYRDRFASTRSADRSPPRQ